MRKRQDDAVLTDFDATERDSLSTRFELEAIVKVLKTRFPNYSNKVSSLTVLSSSIDLETLRKIFELACRATTFKEFCKELNALRASRDVQMKVVDKEKRRELVILLGLDFFHSFCQNALEVNLPPTFLEPSYGFISTFT